jgi:hypothetical protein
VRVEGGGLGAARVALLACGWRHTVVVTATGTVYSFGRGVNGQLGHGGEADVATPTLVAALSAGPALTREALLAAAIRASRAGDGTWPYVAPGDRYAVVPDDDAAGAAGGEEGAEGAAQRGADSGGLEVPDASDAACDGGGGASLAAVPCGAGSGAGSTALCVPSSASEPATGGPLKRARATAGDA